MKKKIEHKETIFIDIKEIKTLIFDHLYQKEILSRDGSSKTNPKFTVSVSAEPAYNYDSMDEVGLEGFNIVIIEKGEIDEKTN